jgi:diguanylate cyclase (GGDEF)-like protein
MTWLTVRHGLLLVGVLAAPVSGEPEWTAAEREYLARTSHIRVCADPAYHPFDFIDADGRHRGIAADLLAEISRIIDVPMRVVPSSDWAETMRLAQRGECDLVAMLNKTPARAAYLDFTEPYVAFENAIVTHRPAYHRGLASLAGRTLALPGDYRLVELIDSLHPDIEVIRVAHTDAALRAVSRGDAYATLVNQQRLVNHVQRLRLRNVHFAGDAELPDHYRFGVVQTEGGLLVGILDKALATIPPERVSRIMEQWYVVPVEPTIALRVVLIVTGLALVVIAFLLLHLYHRSRYYRMLVLKNLELERLSGTDALTRTANRRALDARLTEEMERARRHARPLAVILFDLDQFKSLNDRYGHHVGDDLLVELVDLAAPLQRVTDVIGRWGGDEFLVICSEAAAPDGHIVAERLRLAVEAHSFQPGLRITISLGVAEAQEGDTPVALLGRADAAMYRAKAAGGNRVEVAEANAQPSIARGS